MLIIVSYREEYEQRCARSCHCLHNSNSSSFAIHAAATEEDAAKWLAERLTEDEHASFNNVVFDGWTQVERSGQYAYSTSPQKGIGSIDVYCGSPFTDDGWIGYAEDENRLNALQERLTLLTKSRIEDIQAARKKSKEQKRTAEVATQAAEQRKRDEAELVRLQQKLGK